MPPCFINTLHLYLQINQIISSVSLLYKFIIPCCYQDLLNIVFSFRVFDRFSFQSNYKCKIQTKIKICVVLFLVNRLHRLVGSWNSMLLDFSLPLQYTGRVAILVFHYSGHIIQMNVSLICLSIIVYKLSLQLIIIILPHYYASETRSFSFSLSYHP